MANKVRGITIEFNADSSQISKALSDINLSASQTQKQLNDVNRLLKLDPTNVELLTQKQQLLDQQITNTTNKLETLKQAEESLKASGMDENSEQMMALRREIESSKISMSNLTEQSKKTKEQIKGITTNNKNNNKLLKDDVKQMNLLSPILTKLGVGSVASLGTLGGVGVAVGVIEKLIQAAYEVSEYTDNLQTLSDITGIATKELQEFEYMSELVDVSTSNMTASLKRLVKAMGEAAEGSGTYLDAFEDLGVEILDANGNLRKASEVFWEVIEALGQMENETERDAIAMSLLGRSAMDLNPLIKKTKEEIQALKDEAARSGYLLNDEDIAKSNEFNDSIQRLKKSFEGLKNSALIPFADAITPVVEKITEFISFITNEELYKIPVEAFKNGITQLIPGFQSIKTFTDLFTGQWKEPFQKIGIEPKSITEVASDIWDFLHTPLTELFSNSKVDVNVSTDDSTLAKDLNVKITGQEVKKGRTLYR